MHIDPNQLLRLLAHPELASLVVHTRPAWVWDASGCAPLWMNGAGAAFLYGPSLGISDFLERKTAEAANDHSRKEAKTPPPVIDYSSSPGPSDRRTRLPFTASLQNFLPNALGDPNAWVSPLTARRLAHIAHFGKEDLQIHMPLEFDFRGKAVYLSCSIQRFSFSLEKKGDVGALDSSREESVNGTLVLLKDIPSFLYPFHPLQAFCDLLREEDHAVSIIAPNGHCLPLSDSAAACFSNSAALQEFCKEVFSEEEKKETPTLVMGTPPEFPHQVQFFPSLNRICVVRCPTPQGSWFLLRGSLSSTSSSTSVGECSVTQEEEAACFSKEEEIPYLAESEIATDPISLENTDSSDSEIKGSENAEMQDSSLPSSRGQENETTEEEKAYAPTEEASVASGIQYEAEKDAEEKEPEESKKEMEEQTENEEHVFEPSLAFDAQLESDLRVLKARLESGFPVNAADWNNEKISSAVSKERIEANLAMAVEMQREKSVSEQNSSILENSKNHEEHNVLTLPKGVQKERNEVSVLNALPIGVAIVALRDVLYANTAFLDLLGYDSLQELEEAGGLEAFFSEKKGPSQEQSSVRMAPRPLYVHQKNGAIHPVRAHLSLISWEGRHRLMFSLFSQEENMPPTKQTQHRKIENNHHKNSSALTVSREVPVLEETQKEEKACCLKSLEEPLEKQDQVLLPHPVPVSPPSEETPLRAPPAPLSEQLVAFLQALFLPNLKKISRAADLHSKEESLSLSTEMRRIHMLSTNLQDLLQNALPPLLPLLAPGSYKPQKEWYCPEKLLTECFEQLQPAAARYCVFLRKLIPAKCPPIAVDGQLLVNLLFRLCLHLCMEEPDASGSQRPLVPRQLILSFCAQEGGAVRLCAQCAPLPLQGQRIERVPPPETDLPSPVFPRSFLQTLLEGFMQAHEGSLHFSLENRQLTLIFPENTLSSSSVL